MEGPAAASVMVTDNASKTSKASSSRMKGKSQTGRSAQLLNLPLPFRLPSTLQGYIGEHKNWCSLFQQAETLTREDLNMQIRSAKGLTIPTRHMPVELISRFYAQYCDLINSMYDSYLRNVQLQRSEYIMDIISILLKRMYELRQELVTYIVNDYIYVDTAVKQLFLTPFDIQIVVPYHFAKEMRQGSLEELLQKMWRDGKIRKLKMERKLAAEISKPKKPVIVYSDPELAARAAASAATDVEEEEVEEEEEFVIENTMSAENVLKYDPNKKIISILNIQRHERYRQFYLMDFTKKCFDRKKYSTKKVPEAPIALKIKAAELIQRAYRRFMEIKRKRVMDDRRDMILGLIPDVNYIPRVTKTQEANKLYENRYKKRTTIEKKYYLKEIEKEKIRLLWMREGHQITDITSEIIEWFKEWWLGYGFLPQYPYPLEQGTIVVVRGDYPTVQEQAEADEKWNKLNKGLTAEQKKQNADAAKRDRILKMEALKARIKKEAEAMYKAKCNPASDPGYSIKISAENDEIKRALMRYRQAWSIFDQYDPEEAARTIYGYMQPLITEKLMEDMYKETRAYVDTLMRLELKVFIKVQKEMFKEIGKLWPQFPPRPRPPRPPKVPLPVIVNEELLNQLQGVFDLEIISKPKTKMDDVLGDTSYSNYEKNIADPWATFPSPCYGDVKRRLVLSCVFGAGVAPTAPRNKAVLLMGIPRNGKSFLVDAIAGELNAVKFDISPSVLSNRTKSPIKMLTLIFQAARVFGPSVIFLKEIEKVFYKKVPPAEKNEKAAAYKSPLTKLLKALPVTEKVIFIATCSNPWVAKVAPMMKLFNEKIYVPAPDYNTLRMFFYEELLKKVTTPRTLCVQPLARVFEGIGFGIIHEMFDRVLCPERLIKLGERPFEFSEFMEYILENQIEPLTEYDYAQWMKVFIQYSQFKKDRPMYEEMNKKRADGYEKLEKAQQAKEAKAKK